jgi:hypothetical protein
LVLINTDSGTTTTIAEAAQIQLIAWDGQRIVFQLSSSDDASSKPLHPLVLPIHQQRAPEIGGRQRAERRGQRPRTDLLRYWFLFSLRDWACSGLRPTAAAKNVLVDEEITTVLRSGYDTLSLQKADGSWLGYDIPDAVTNEIDAPVQLDQPSVPRQLGAGP